MLKLFRSLSIILVLASTALAEWASPHNLKLEEEAPAALIPFPREVSWEDEKIKLPAANNWKIKGKASSKDSIKIAWKGLLSDIKSAGKGSMTVSLKSAGSKLNEEASPQGYILTVGKKSITIEANEEVGFFYGLQTLRQLVDGQKSLPACKIKDWPAFKYRGYMHDCGRNFRTLERLKKEIDLAAQLKVNLFHWHLTDNSGWRIQCKKYPVLNDPKTRERDLNSTYSYNDIRELLRYAGERHVLVLPELDMPGHSRYFAKAFNCRMESEQGMKICAELLNEFCSEIPKEICPIVSFGSDETRIANGREFVYMASGVIKENGREHAQWAGHADLVVHPDSIQKRWAEGYNGCVKSLSNITGRTLDYAVGYSNVYPPAMMVRRYFFMRPCGEAKGNDQSLGVVLGIWPDGRVDNKEWIPGMCNMWPSMCAMAERGWVGGAGEGDGFIPEMPSRDTEAGKAYHLFEQRMASIRKSIFKGEDFPMWPESSVSWTLVEPVDSKTAESVRAKVLEGKLDGLTTKTVHCSNLYFRTRDGSGNQGMYRRTKTGVTVWAITTLNVKKAGKYPFMIGFDAPERSNRRWTGVPQNGQWTQVNTRVWINGKEVSNPKVYKLAGQRAERRKIWGFENPLDLEEIWWMLDPTELTLKKGRNTIVIEQPYPEEHLDWSIGFTPLFKHK